MGISRRGNGDAWTSYGQHNELKEMGGRDSEELRERGE